MLMADNESADLKVCFLAQMDDLDTHSEKLYFYKMLLE